MPEQEVHNSSPTKEWNFRHFLLVFEIVDFSQDIEQIDAKLNPYGTYVSQKCDILNDKRDVE